MKAEAIVLSAYFVLLLSLALFASYFFMTLSVFVVLLAGLATEIEKTMIPIFSSSRLVAPVGVPLTLGWTWSYYSMDGQVFTQQVHGFAIGILCFVISAFYLIKNRKRKMNLIFGLGLLILTSLTIRQKAGGLDWRRESQKNFNSHFNQ